MTSMAGWGRAGVWLTYALIASCWIGSEPQTGGSGNTNWLKLCVSDASCDETASCVCGVCTRPCDSVSECDAIGEPAQCVNPGDGDIDNFCARAQLSEHAGICLRMCSSSADCDQGQTCEDGSCVAPDSDARAAVPSTHAQHESAASNSEPADACDARLASCETALRDLIDQSRRPSSPSDPEARVWSCEAGALRSDPAGYDDVYALALSDSALFVAGVATSAGDGLWRLERRSLADLAPDPAFGEGGAVASGETPFWDAAGSLAADATHVYVAGVDGYDDPAGSTVHIEKRALATGELDREFGSAGRLAVSFGGAEAPLGATDHAMGHGLALDAEYLYLGGTGFAVEKRRLRDGESASEFGEGGVARDDASLDSVATSVALRDGVVYVAGPETAGGIRLEARDATTGSLLYSSNEPGEKGACQPQCASLALGSGDDLYVASMNAAGRWRVERRQRASGTLVYSRELAASGTCDGAASLAIEGDAMYVVGSYEQRWRIEKRSLADGSLIESFGQRGAIDAGLTGAASTVAARDGVLYVGGIEGRRAGSQNSVWRLERRSSADGSLIECPAGAPSAPRAPECAGSALTVDETASEPAGCTARVASASACAAANVRASTQAGAGEDWQLPEGAALPDTSLATAALGSEPSSYLMVRGFGLSLPAAARVLGIRVDVTRASAEADALSDAAVRLVKGGTILPGDRSALTPWSTSLTQVSHGGPNDAWESAWAAAELNDPSFGVALRVRPLRDGTNPRAEVDAVQVHVRYCE